MWVEVLSRPANEQF